MRLTMPFEFGLSARYVTLTECIKDRLLRDLLHGRAA